MSRNDMLVHPRKLLSAVARSARYGAQRTEVKQSLERLLELDIARALAICIIVLVHSYYFLATDPNSATEQYLISAPVLTLFRDDIASGALALFFFVSGYALYQNNRVFRTSHDVSRFLRKRAVRIFPLYWIVVTVYIIFFGLLPLGQAALTYNASDIATWFSAYGTTTIIIYYAGLQGLISVPPYVTHQMSALWFVGVILVYYLIYPLIMAFSARTTRFIAAAILVYVALFAVQQIVHTIEPQLFLYYGTFIGGALASKLSLLDVFRSPTSADDNDRRSVSGGTLVIVLGAAAVLMLLLFSTSVGLRTLATVVPIFYVELGKVASLNLLYLIFSLFAVGAITVLVTRSRNASYRSFRLIAYSSYSIYLFQFPVMIAMGFGLKYLLNLTVPQTDAALIILGLPCLFLISYALQSSQDAVIRKIRGRLSARQHVNRSH